MKTLVLWLAILAGVGCGSEQRRGAARSDLRLEGWLPMLEQGLGDRDPRVRCHAAAGLAKLGPSAASAIPLLVCREEDPDPAVRCAAGAALARIQGCSK